MSNTLHMVRNMNEWEDSWFEPSSVPTRFGLFNRDFVSLKLDSKSWKPKFHTAPRLGLLTNSPPPPSQRGGGQIAMFKCDQNFTKHELSFLPLLHTFYTKDFLLAPLRRDVFPRCYVQLKGLQSPLMVNYMKGSQHARHATSTHVYPIIWTSMTTSTSHLR